MASIQIMFNSWPILETLRWHGMAVNVSISPATWIFVQKFIQSNNKETIKALHYQLVAGGFPTERANNVERVSSRYHHINYLNIIWGIQGFHFSGLRHKHWGNRMIAPVPWTRKVCLHSNQGYPPTRWLDYFRMLKFAFSISSDITRLVQPIPPMRCQENAWKLQNWLVSLSRNTAKMRKIN